MGKIYRNLKDHSGERFGRLTAQYWYKSEKDGRIYWHCICDCGNERDIRSDSLTSGNTTSCGCLHREISSRVCGDNFRKDGLSSDRLYGIWSAMKSRCYNPSENGYSYYGGRGISVCTEWIHDFKAFYDWSLANGYSEGLSIDRIDVDGDYCPENCRWADSKTQSRNRTDNVKLTIFGITMVQEDWAKLVGISSGRIHRRIVNLGWSVEDAILTPVNGIPGKDRVNLNGKI